MPLEEQRRRWLEVSSNALIDVSTDLAEIL